MSATTCQTLLLQPVHSSFSKKGFPVPSHFG